MKGNLVLAVVFLALAGCAPAQLYDWGSYEGGLYGYYKAPASQDKFVESLAEGLTKAEKNGKVPPGLYAEYGYFLLSAGKNADAVRYFDKEQAKWPESRIFMQVLLKDAQQAQANPSEAK